MGQPKKFETADALRMRDAGMDMAAMARAFGVHRSAVRERLRRADAAPAVHAKTARWHAKRDRFLAFIADAASRGAPAPTNPELAEACGGNPTDAVKVLTRMVADGVLVIERCAFDGTAPSEGGRGLQCRRFTIVATGARTRWTKPPRRTYAKAPEKPATGPSPERRSIYTLKGASRPAGLSDAFLYGALAEVVREVRRSGREVVRGDKRGTFRVDGNPVDADTLRAIAARGRGLAERRAP